jgi:membrane protein YqaA with SNARE-associated domain
LSDLPVVGPILFSHDFMVYVSIGIVAGVWYFLRHTRGGMILRAVGENHDAAHALGYRVRRIRVLAIMFGGACAGMGGAYLSLIRVPQWTEGMTAGAGWIALALVVFRVLAAVARGARRLSLRRHRRPATQSAGGRRAHPGRILVNVSVPDNHSGPGTDFVRQGARVAQRARLAEPVLPCFRVTGASRRRSPQSVKKGN